MGALPGWAELSVPGRKRAAIWGGRRPIWVRNRMKNRKKSQKNEANFESFSLILKIVMAENRVLKCMKSLLSSFLVSSELPG